MYLVIKASATIGVTSNSDSPLASCMRHQCPALLLAHAFIHRVYSAQAASRVAQCMRNWIVWSLRCTGNRVHGTLATQSDFDTALGKSCQLPCL